MNVILERFSYAPTETEGKLHVGDYSFFTMERPWIAWKAPGGKPFSSCIPDGTYSVRWFRRTEGGEAYILSNPELGVFETKQEMERGGGGGRYACLIHPANWVEQVVGCIAPGEDRGILSGKRAVLHSKEAMRIILEVLSTDEGHTLEIRPALGTT